MPRTHRSSKMISTKPAWVIALWIAILCASIPLANLASSRFGATGTVLRDSEAQRVAEILSDQFGSNDSDTTLVVGYSKSPTDDPQFLATYAVLVSELAALEGVVSLTRFDANLPIRLRSDPGAVENRTVTATIVQMGLGDVATLERIRAVTGRYSTPDTQFLVTGSTAVTRDFALRSEQDVKRGELAALPLIALVLVFAFGALTASAIPIVVGLVSITTTLAALWVLTHVFAISSFAQSVVTLLGLGAGIDYALLIVTRFREEIARGLDAHTAAAQATRTAGRAVMFSGLTVAIAMAGLLVPDLAFVRAMGVAGVLVILVTVLASVTLVPALLALLGHRVNLPRIGRRNRSSVSGQANPFWGRWADVVMAHPWRWTIMATAAILVIAAPAATMTLGYTGPFGLARNVESRRALELIRGLELGGTMDTFEVIVDLGKPGGYDAQARASLRKLDAALSEWNEVRLVVSPFIVARAFTEEGGGGGQTVTSNQARLNLSDVAAFTERFLSSDRRYVRMSVIPKNTVRSPEIAGWMDRIWLESAKAGFGARGERVLLGGAPVSSREFTDAITRAMPVAVGAVFIATFVLLGIAFRSIVLPLKSILMNTLTVAASYGVVTLVFQHGILAPLFGAGTDVGVTDSSLPLVMFAVTFGLSMDYEVFLLSRVQEAHLAGLGTREAMRVALERTASVITSAALIMLIVFAAFITGEVVANKVIGLGLSMAVLLDATIVRLVLVPAVMVLAGRWNWWLPGVLGRIVPRVRLEH